MITPGTSCQYRNSNTVMNCNITVVVSSWPGNPKPTLCEGGWTEWGWENLALRNNIANDWTGSVQGLSSYGTGWGGFSMLSPNYTNDGGHCPA